MPTPEQSSNPAPSELGRKDSTLLPLDTFAEEVRKKAGFLPDNVRLIDIIPPPSHITSKKRLDSYIEKTLYDPPWGWEEYMSQFPSRSRSFFSRAVGSAIDVGYQTVGGLRGALYEELLAAKVSPETRRYITSRPLTENQATFLKNAFEELPEESPPPS